MQVPERRSKTYFIMKKLFFCAAALLAAISFAACSDDDETNLTATPDNIAGTWKIVHEEGWEIYDGEKDTWSFDYPDEDGRYITTTFNKNGTWTSTEYEYDDYEDKNYTEYKTGSYSISDDTLTIKEDYSNESYIYEIKKLTKSELVLLDIYEEPDYSFEETSTYKRIK